jgi:hypothetical protein
VCVCNIDNVNSSKGYCKIFGHLLESVLLVF